MIVMRFRIIRANDLLMFLDIKHVAQGGTWKEYEEKVGKRVEALKEVLAEAETKSTGSSMGK